MVRPIVLVVLGFASIGTSFPTGSLEYESLAGLSDSEIEAIIPILPISEVESPPGPLEYNGTKLVNDYKHPYEPLQPGEIRGPCPGLNTLASHGYLPRNGIATPSQIINAVQEGFNMGNDIATFLTYCALLADGNPLTNLMSIGGKTPFTGPDPPPPAIVGGLDTHAVFEGDTSMTRADKYFGDNHSFNETLFQQFVEYSAEYGSGKYNLNVASELRYQLTQQSIATNPEFTFVSPRYFTAYGEAILPLLLFVDGRNADGELSMSEARGFFEEMRMPDGFFRANQPYGIKEIGAGIDAISAAHPVDPGNNEGIDNYVPDPNSPRHEICSIYTAFVNDIVQGLYPDPKGVLLEAMKANLENLYSPLKEHNCTQVYLYGK